MRRRDLIALIAGTAVTGPPAARAQQPGKVPRLGYLSPNARSDPNGQRYRSAFLEGLRELGYVEQQSFTIEDRYADGDLDRLPGLAADLVRLPVDVIITGGEAPIRAAKQATDKIPIVMGLAPDPVGSGLVASLARPGGNLTGLSALAADLAGKRVELLKEFVPRASRLAVMWNSANQAKVVEWQNTEAAAQPLRVALHSVEVRAPEDFDAALGTIARDHPDGLVVFTESLTLINRERIAKFALANGLPMISELREFAEAGALVSYGTSQPDLWRRTAAYVDKILRGVKPADLPVEQPTKFELVVNAKTAAALGLTIPPLILSRADEVIE